MMPILRLITLTFAAAATTNAFQSWRPHHVSLIQHRSVNTRAPLWILSAEPSNENNSEKINVNDHPSLYRIRLPRAPGIEWGTDLSFAFVYVRQLEPVGPADLSGEVLVGDQICELAPILKDGSVGAVIPLIGAPFDTGKNQKFVKRFQTMYPTNSLDVLMLPQS